MIIVSIACFYYVRRTDFEETLVEGDPSGRIYLYIGMLLLCIVGIVSIANEFIN